MIRRGKVQGWLNLPSEALLTWAQLNEIALHEVKIGSAPGKGSALLASQQVENSTNGAECLLTVPHELILSLERVRDHTKVDRDFRELFECLGDLSLTPRGAILSFLLSQASISCPDLRDRVGVHSPFTDYVKTLPLELLPTLWTSDELMLLVGTTLAPATASKLKSLRREYDLLCSAAANTRWFRTVAEHVELDDWLQIDAMYRSRALDYPNIGHCMVPCLDIANHASGEQTIAIYEKDNDGNAILLLREGKTLDPEQEVTISYGDEKGACEMLFSYGFLEESMTTAEALFLSLNVDDNDIFGSAKSMVANCAPGFKLIDAGDGEIDWNGDFIWLLCVTAEDGLHFDLAQTIEGVEEVQGFFGSHELIGGAADLRRVLSRTELWDVYRLRAITLLQQRVFDQMQTLFGTQEHVEAVSHGAGTNVRDWQYELAMKLRRLEFDLLDRAYEDFENQKVGLAQSEVVMKYLEAMRGNDAKQEDHPA